MWEMICNYSAYGKVRNQHKDQKAANRHCRISHQVESSLSNTIEENEINETNEINLVINAGFDIQDAEKESHHVTYLLDLCDEDEKHCNFIKHLNNDTVRHYLVVLSQDK